MSVRELKSASAGHYYESGHDGQYYAQDRGEAGEIRDSQWLGNLAADLNLKGNVKAHDFQLLLNGTLPDGTALKESGGRQTEEGGRRAGYDFTNSIPKSFDVAGIAFEKDIKSIHRQANAESMKYLESKLSTRVTVNKKTRKVQPNSCAIAAFTHHTSRADDPNTHTHNVVLNVTKAAGKIRAINGKDLYDLQTKVRSVYHDAVARLAVEKGFAIRFEQTRSGATHPELKNVTREQVKAFSKRSTAIQRVMDKKGADDYATSKQVARGTRQKKSGKTVEELREVWRQTAKDVGVDFSKLKEHGKVEEMEKIEGISAALAGAAEHSISFAMGRDKEDHAEQKQSDQVERAEEKQDSGMTTFWQDAHEAWAERFASLDERERRSNAHEGQNNHAESVARSESQLVVKEQPDAQTSSAKQEAPAAELEARIGQDALAAQAQWDKKNGVNNAKPDDGLYAKLSELKSDENAYIKSVVGSVKGIESATEKDGVIQITNSHFDSTRTYTSGKTQEAVTFGLVGTATEMKNSKGEVAGFAVKNKEGEIVGTAKGVGDYGSLKEYKPLNTLKQDSEKITTSGKEYGVGRQEKLGSGYSATEMLNDKGERAGYMLSKDDKAIGTIKADALSRELVKTQKVQDSVGGSWLTDRQAEIKVGGQIQKVRYGESKSLGDGLKATSLYGQDGKFAGSLISKNGKAESFTRERLVKDPRPAMREKLEQKADQNKGAAYFHSSSGGLMKRSFMNQLTKGRFGSVRKASFSEKITHYSFKLVSSTVSAMGRALVGAVAKSAEVVVDAHRENKLKDAGISDKDAKLMVASARANGGDMAGVSKALESRANAFKAASEARGQRDQEKVSKKNTPAEKSKLEVEGREAVAEKDKPEAKDAKLDDDKGYQEFVAKLDKLNGYEPAEPAKDDRHADGKQADGKEAAPEANAKNDRPAEEAKQPESKEVAQAQERNDKEVAPSEAKEAQPVVKEQRDEGKQAVAKDDQSQPVVKEQQPEAKQPEAEARESKVEERSDATPGTTQSLNGSNVKSESVQREGGGDGNSNDKAEARAESRGAAEKGDNAEGREQPSQHKGKGSYSARQSRPAGATAKAFASKARSQMAGVRGRVQQKQTQQKQSQQKQVSTQQKGR